MDGCSSGVAYRAILERTQLAEIEWDYQIVLLLLGFAGCLFVMYSVVPMFLRKAGATAMNLSLLTSDFYGLLFGIFLFGFEVFSFRFPFPVALRFEPLCLSSFLDHLVVHLRICYHSGWTCHLRIPAGEVQGWSRGT